MSFPEAGTMAGCGGKRQYSIVKNKQASKQQGNHSNVISSLEEKNIRNSKFNSFIFFLYEKNMSGNTNIFSPYLDSCMTALSTEVFFLFNY